MKDGREVWRSRWYDDQGNRRQKNFGYADDVSEREAKARWVRWMVEWTSRVRVRNPIARESTYTVTELAHDFLEHAKRAYRKHERVTSTVWNVAYAMQALIDAFGSQCASAIDGPSIAAVRDAMINGEDKRGNAYKRSVKTVNDRLYLIKQAFLWGRERALVSKDNLFDIMQVKPLRAGRCGAKAPKAVQPIAECWVSLTKRHCSSQVSAMIDLQWLTGMRPGDAVVMRACDIDRSCEIWLYEPHTHKMEHKGVRRIVPLGQRCQALLRPFIEDRESTAYLFSPGEARAQRNAARRAERQTPLWPSHSRRYEEQRASEPLRAPGDLYTVSSYRKAIHHACRAAAAELCKSNPDAVVPMWNPNQLRHAAATRLNKLFGLEDVAVMLGHADHDTTRIYALPDVERAVNIAKQVG